jgi:hypothetical protein
VSCNRRDLSQITFPMEKLASMSQRTPLGGQAPPATGSTSRKSAPGTDGGSLNGGGAAAGGAMGGVSGRLLYSFGGTSSPGQGLSPIGGGSRRQVSFGGPGTNSMSSSQPPSPLYRLNNSGRLGGVTSTSGRLQGNRSTSQLPVLEERPSVVESVDEAAPDATAQGIGIGFGGSSS